MFKAPVGFMCFNVHTIYVRDVYYWDNTVVSHINQVSILFVIFVTIDSDQSLEKPFI